MEDYNTEQVKRKYHEEWWNYETDEGLIDAVLYQTNEHVWLISREDYQRGLTMLLNRRIDEGELEKRKNLLNEVLKAYAETINTSESDVKKAIKNKLAQLKRKDFTSQRGPERH